MTHTPTAPMTANGRYRRLSPAFIVVVGWLASTVMVSTLALRFGWLNAWLDPVGLLLIQRSAASLLAALLSAAALYRFRLPERRAKLRLIAELALWIVFFFALFVIAHKPLLDGFHGSGDHILHQKLASLTEQALWEHGALRVWTGAIGLGEPLNDLYPPGGGLLLVAARALTLHLISIERLYVWTVFFAYAAFAALLYRVVRPRFGLLAGAFTLFLLLLDGGDWYFGWYSVFEGGLWANLLSLGLSFNAFALYADPAALRNRRHAAELIVSTAGSILLHPFALFLNLFGIVIIHLTRWTFRSLAEPMPLGAGWARFVCAALGYGLAAFWWVPFAVSGEWVFPYGFWGRFMPDPGRMLLEGDLFRNATPYIAILGLAGMLWGLVARNLLLPALALFTLFNLFMGTEAARHVFALSAAQRFFDHMQVERLFAVGKIGCILLASALIGRCLQRASRLPHPRRAWIRLQAWIWRPAFRRPIGWVEGGHAILTGLRNAALALAILLPVVSFADGFIYAAWRWGVEPSTHLFYSYPDRPFEWESLVEVREELARRLPEESDGALVNAPFPPNRLYARDAWKVPSLSMRLPLGVYVFGYQPATVLGMRPWFINEWMLDIAQIRYILERKTDPIPELPEWRGLSPILQNRDFILYERQSTLESPWRLHGEGEIERLPSDNASLRFEIRGADEDSYLRLGISRYRKWNVYQDGVKLDTLLPARNGEPEEAWKLIGFPVSDGIIEARYESDGWDRAGAWISLAALLGTLAGLAWRAPLRAALRFRDWRGKTSIALDIGVSVGLIAIMAAPLLAFGAAANRVFPETFTYLGAFADQAGARSGRPDGVNDLVFLLQWHNLERREAASMQLIRIDEGGELLTDEQWSTYRDGAGRAGVLDMLGRRADRMDGRVLTPYSAYQRWMIFLPNPYWGGVPAPPRMKCVLEFSDGEKRVFFYP